MCVGNGLIVHAAGNEYGGATGGQTGDQTGREICTAGYYYSPSMPWEHVLRFEGTAEASEDVSNVDHGETYTVQPGDTLWAIAERCGSTVEELARLNELQDPGLIYPGQVLRLPGSVTEAPAEESATVTAPVLSEGSTGASVEALQTLLLLCGTDVGPCGIDGEFGHDTWVAVCDFQRGASLPVTGKADGRTWAALLGV
jgi:hypothetical protein